MESVFQYVIHTSEIGRFAVYAGGTAVVLLLLLTIQISMVRVHLVISQRRAVNTKQMWREIISKLLMGEKVLFPKIYKSDVYHILEEFDYVFGMIRGKELDLLRQGLIKLNFSVSLKKLLRSRNLKKRLFALVTLGNLQDKSSWDQILTSLDTTQPVISLSAARALTLIDPQRAVKEIVPVILKRRDWPWANIAHILKIAGPELVCKDLSELIIGSGEGKQPSLLRLYDVLRCEDAFPVTCQIISEAKEDKVVSVCLNISRDPNIINLAREYVGHERWHVRMNAAVAIGRFGQKDDLPLVIDLLKDKEWWVRYRAAQSIISMPFMNKDQIHKLRSQLNDKYADDILVQVITENSV